MVKGQQGRTIYLEPELLDLLKELHGRRRLDCPYVFHNNRVRINNFRTSRET